MPNKYKELDVTIAHAQIVMERLASNYPTIDPIGVLTGRATAHLKMTLDCLEKLKKDLDDARRKNQELQRSVPKSGD